MGLHERHGASRARLYPDAGLPTRSRSPVHRRWQEVDDGIEEWNDPDIFSRGTAVERDDRASPDAKTKSFDQILLRQLTHREILFQ